MMILSDARTTVDVSDHYVIQPQFDWSSGKLGGSAVGAGLSSSSDANSRSLSVDELKALVADA